MSTGREHQRAAYRLARDQYGVLSTAQLLGAGMSPDMIRSWRRTGRLVPAYRAVHSLGRPIDSIEGWWMAAVLAAGRGSVLAGEAAAWALGFGIERERIDVARTAGRRRLLKPEVRRGIGATVRKASLLPGDHTSVGPIPTMSVARTLTDIASQSSPALLRRYFIEAGRHGKLTLSTLEGCRYRGKGFRGHPDLVRLVDGWTSGSGVVRSPLEGEFRLFCAERRIAPPQTNARLSGYEVDCLWSREKLVVELDGRQFHDDAFAFERDRQKSNDLATDGYTVLRITWKMLQERPGEVDRLVKSALGCN